MKKLLLSFLSLLIVAGVAFAESSYTIVFKSTNGSDSSTALSGTATSTYVSEGMDYVSSCSSTNAYSAQKDYGLKLGASSKTGNIIVNISELGQVIATRVVIRAAKYGSDGTTQLQVSINGEKSIETGYLTSKDFTDFEFTRDDGSKLKSVKVATSAKRAYVESITVYYEEEDGDTREDVALSFPDDSYSAILGQEFVAPELAGAPEGAEIVYTSSREAVATVAANGTVTLINEGRTTITASFDGNDAYKPAEATYILNVVNPNAEHLYKLVTDINDLNEGDIVTIACNSNGTVMTNMEVENYREQKSTVFYSNNLYLANDDEIMQLELGKSGNNWTFKTLNYKGTNGYIGNTSSSKNYCTINSTVTTGFAASVAISANGDASIQFTSSSRNNLKYNASSGQERFSCYSSGQTAVQIYKRIAISMPMAAPVAEVAVNDVVLYSENGFDVVYAISQSDDEVPADFEAYDEAIVLKQLQEGMNYIWAKTVVGPYESEAECIHVYENVDPEEGACTYTYSGVAPEDNCWVVIGAEVNGKHYFMGPDGKATLATVVENKFAGYASHFNNTISEYQHVGGALTVKAVSRAAANEGLTLEVADNGVATVANGDGVLGFDAENKVFSTDAANKNLKVFATEGDINTGVDNVAVDVENAKVEYYNLQGVRVENPAKGGLYIKREGSKVSKVAL